MCWIEITHGQNKIPIHWLKSLFLNNGLKIHIMFLIEWRVDDGRAEGRRQKSMVGIRSLTEVCHHHIYRMLDWRRVYDSYCLTLNNNAVLLECPGRF